MLVFFVSFVVLLTVPVLWPQMDLFLSGLFYRSDIGFFLERNIGFLTLHNFANVGARVFVVSFAALALASWAKRKTFFINAKAWMFLLLALLIGPGLVANVGFKDHWGRARPREISEFGGSYSFSSALTPQFDQARSNGSFVSGDGAFGFFLPAVAYVVPPRSRRRAFWLGLAGGGAFGFARIAMGAHFFSDVIYAAFLMLLVTALIHAAMFGKAETFSRWAAFLTPVRTPVPSIAQWFLSPLRRIVFRDKTCVERPARQPED